MEVTTPPPARIPSPLATVPSRPRSAMLDRRQLARGLAALSLAPSVVTLAPGVARGASPSDPTAVVLAPALTLLFHDRDETGVVAFEREDGARADVSNFERARAAYVPASTFKIPHTVIALETGVVTSLDDRVFKWDGEVRKLGGKPVDAWNRDQTLREAFRNSAIWVYQQVAREVGPERMARLLAAFDYGNRTIGEIDRFWLDGPLRISALEQLAFLKTLRAGALPVSARAQSLAREAMLVETSDAFVLSGKTGWAFDQKIGWFVGWIESGSRSRAFAMNLDVASPKSLAARSGIVKSAARTLGVM